MITDKKPALWTPNEAQLKSSEINRFTKSINAAYGLNIETYEQLHEWSINNPERFWDHIWEFFEILGVKGSEIVTNIDKMPGAEWFPDSKLSFAENLLKYATTTPDKIAIVELGEHGRRQTLSYKELASKVNKLSCYFKKIGVNSGDVIAGILPNSQYSVIAMLAANCIGAVWTSCSPDFGVNGILDRFLQTKPKVLICCDGYYYGNKSHSCIDKITEISDSLTSLEKTIIVEYFNTEEKVDILSVFTLWDDALTSEQTNTNYLRTDFNHPLYILYSSGTTGKPKCIVHGVGGTLLQHIKELGLHTNVKPETHLFYYTTCGWMMWNWLVSGLALGSTLFLYDGSPFHPDKSRLYDLIDNENINVFGASAKFYSASEKFGLLPQQTHNLESLYSLLSTGSPLNPESYDFIYQNIKSDVCLSSISGGTDIISCFTLGNPALPVYRGELQCIGLGMDVHFVDDSGNSLIEGKGELVCRTSFPSMPIYFWNDADSGKYQSAYFSRFDNVWAHGDYGEFKLHQKPTQKCVVIHGRSDAVLNPGGVRIGTAEIYRQVEKVEGIFEAIAVGQEWEDDIRIILFVTLKEGFTLNENLISKIKTEIRANTTPRHIPAKVIQVNDIPRTLSGKIVELAVRNIIHNKPVTNTEALANPQALEQFKDIKELNES